MSTVTLTRPEGNPISIDYAEHNADPNNLDSAEINEILTKARDQYYLGDTDLANCSFQAGTNTYGYLADTHTLSVAARQGPARYVPVGDRFVFDLRFNGFTSTFRDREPENLGVAVGFGWMGTTANGWIDYGVLTSIYLSNVGGNKGIVYGELEPTFFARLPWGRHAFRRGNLEYMTPYVRIGLGVIFGSAPNATATSGSFDAGGSLAGGFELFSFSRIVDSNIRFSIPFGARWMRGTHDSHEESFQVGGQFEW